MKKKSALREWINAVVIALIVVLTIRTFFFEIFSIPTGSMEKTLQTGDFIFVSKTSYGSRIPITLLSFPFLHKYFPLTEIKSFLSLIELPYWRLPTTSEIKRNDVVVFNYPLDEEFPVDHRTYFIKRCIALPGDTFEINNGEIFINNESVKTPDNAQYNYHVKIESKTLDSAKLAELDITEGGRISSKGDFALTLTSQKAQEIKDWKGIGKVNKIKEKKDFYTEYIFPHNANFKWNMDNWGPLRIPKKGDTLKLSTNNISLYENIISNYEENKLEIRNDSIFINDTFTLNYITKMNYYFTLGDNRHMSDDSRFWGFLPENHIVGKAKYILVSVDKNKSFFSKFRWKRCFKKIR